MTQQLFRFYWSYGPTRALESAASAIRDYRLTPAKLLPY